MATFNIEVCETNTAVISVEANTLEEALSKTDENYRNGDIDLSELDEVNYDYSINAV